MTHKTKPGKGKARCNSCGYFQDADLGFECKKCGGETFTKEEYKSLEKALKGDSKYVEFKL